MTVQLIEGGRKEMLAMFHDFMERDAAALDVALLHVPSDGRRIADLPRKRRPAGDNGIDGEQNGYGIPLHPCLAIRGRLPKSLNTASELGYLGNRP